MARGSLDTKLKLSLRCEPGLHLDAVVGGHAARALEVILIAV